MTNKIAFEIKHDTSLYTKNDSVFPWMKIALDKSALLALDLSFQIILALLIWLPNDHLTLEGISFCSMHLSSSQEQRSEMYTI